MGNSINRSLLTIVLLLLASCSGFRYKESMKLVNGSYYSGSPASALAAATKAIDTESGEQHLYRMERAIIHQRMGNYDQSSQDLIAADEHLEVIDYTNQTWEQVLNFTISPSETKYRGQPHEKILLNTLNILNALFSGNLSDARVEVRRAGSWYDYFNEQRAMENTYDYRSLLTMLLYGLVFEFSGDKNQAYSAYQEALKLCDADFIGARALDCAKNIGHSHRFDLEKQYGHLAPDSEGCGVVLVVVMSGRSPFKVERQMKIRGPYLNTTYQGVSARHINVDTVTYPEMVKRSHKFRAGAFQVGDSPMINLVQGVDIEGQAMARFQEEKPGIIGACITRLIYRAILKYGTAELLKGDKKEKDKKKQKQKEDLANAVGSLVSGIFEVFDEPDLRCWSLLPGSIHVGLATVKAGDHKITLQMRGQGNHQQNKTVKVAPNKLAIAQFFVMN